MVTPFCADGAIDWPAYRDMVAWYVDRGVGGVYANCLSSEMECLTDDERVKLAEEAVAVATGRVPVAATGNLGPTPAAHLALCRRLAAAGVDVVMLVVPAFLNEDEALGDYFLGLAREVDAPLGLYECPVPRRYHLSLNVVARLAASGRFVAYKETSEDLDKIRAVQQATAATPLSLLQACNAYVLEAARFGVLGSMSIAAIHLPDLMRDILCKGLAGDPDAERLQSMLCAMHLAQRPVHPQGSKYLLSRRGLSIGLRCRRFGIDLTAEALHTLEYAASAWFTPDGAIRDL
jgi:4-hydroxy-tetrahydrodipicolinate synthase